MNFQQYPSFQTEAFSSLQKSKSLKQFSYMPSQILSSKNQPITSIHSPKSPNGKIINNKMSPRIKEESTLKRNVMALQFHQPEKYRTQRAFSNFNQVDNNQSNSSSEQSDNEINCFQNKKTYNSNHENHLLTSQNHQHNRNFKRKKTQGIRSFKRQLVFDQYSEKNNENDGNDLNINTRGTMKNKDKNYYQQSINNIQNAIKTSRENYCLRQNKNIKNYPQDLQFSQIQPHQSVQQQQMESMQRSLKDKFNQSKHYKSSQNLHLQCTENSNNKNQKYYSKRHQKKEFLPRQSQIIKPNIKEKHIITKRSFPTQQNQYQNQYYQQIRFDNYSNCNHQPIYSQNSIGKAPINQKVQNQGTLKYKKIAKQYKKNNQNLKKQNYFLMDQIKRYKKNQKHYEKQIQLLNAQIFKLVNRVEQLQVEQKYKSNRGSQRSFRKSSTSGGGFQRNNFGKDNISNQQLNQALQNALKSSSSGFINNNNKDRIQVKLKRSTSSNQKFFGNQNPLTPKNNKTPCQENNFYQNQQQFGTSKFANFESFKKYPSQTSNLMNKAQQHKKIISGLSNISQNYTNNQALEVNLYPTPNQFEPYQTNTSSNRQQMARIHQQLHNRFCQVMDQCAKQKNSKNRQALRKELSTLVNQMDQIRQYFNKN